MTEIEVASFTDAWIETYMEEEFNHKPTVASFTDAWIETRWVYCMVIPFASHLLQMRGLKHPLPGFIQSQVQSHLLQMRGLKPTSYKLLSGQHRRIFYRCVD